MPDGVGIKIKLALLVLSCKNSLGLTNSAGGCEAEIKLQQQIDKWPNSSGLVTSIQKQVKWLSLIYEAPADKQQNNSKQLHVDPFYLPFQIVANVAHTLYAVDHSLVDHFMQVAS
jgi:hypothetical protein